MFFKNAALFVETPSQHCQTRAIVSFFLSRLVRGWFKGYCIWLDSNIVLSPDRGWPHMGVPEEEENQVAFPYIAGLLVISYPWQPPALGSLLCPLSTETGFVLAADVPTPLWIARAMTECLATFHVVQSLKSCHIGTVYAHLFKWRCSPSRLFPSQPARFHPETYQEGRGWSY